MKTAATDDAVAPDVTAAKRKKIEHKSSQQQPPLGCDGPSIRSVLADELCRPVRLESVVCAQLAQQSGISSAMRALTARLPLPARLQHLKRVRPDRSIILFAQREFDVDLPDVLNDPAPLTDRTKLYLLAKHIEPAIVDLLLDHQTVSVHQVAAEAPPLRWQFTAANALWPCKFHPNQAAESRYNNTTFDAAQTALHQQNALIVRLVRDHVGAPVGMAVDPRSGRIVAVGRAEAADTHPLMHSAMVLIDAVARSQLAGAWNDWPVPGDGDGGSLPDDAYDSGLCLGGIASPIRALIASQYPLAKFGAQSTVTRRTDVAAAAAAVGDGDNLAKYGPYLGTGYDVYLSEEPCMLCAMALVHSRVRTVFYERSMANGALGSLAKLHTVRALNHHYEVYQIRADIRAGI